MPDSADDAFVSAARALVAGMLDRPPELATEPGDPRYDHELTPGTPAYYDEAIRWCGDRLGDLRAISMDRMSPQNRVDAQILANRLELIRFNMGELRDPEWNPLSANPGRAIYLLLARDFAPLPERLRCVARRLAAIPGALAAARQVAGPMPAIHLQTALIQFGGTAHLAGVELDHAIAAAPAAPAKAAAEIAAARSAALDATEEHLRWLRQRLADPERGGGGRDPPRGAGVFSRQLRLTLGAESDARATGSP